MVTTRAFDEIIDFLTSTPAPAEVVRFKPSATAQSRLEDLLERKMEKALSTAEIQELEQFLMIEHLMRLAKARAKQRLQND